MDALPEDMKEEILSHLPLFTMLGGASSSWKERSTRCVVNSHRLKAEQYFDEGLPLYKWRLKGGSELPAIMVEKYVRSMFASEPAPLVEYRCALCNRKKTSILGNECCLRKKKEERRLSACSVPILMTICVFTASHFIKLLPNS